MKKRLLDLPDALQCLFTAVAHPAPLAPQVWGSMQSHLVRWASTYRFLGICGKRYKLTRISVGMAHESVPRSVSYSKAFSPESSVFSDHKSYRGWPAIWEAVKEFGIDDGCGNSDQYQIRSGLLSYGVFHKQPRKGWVRIV